MDPIKDVFREFFVILEALIKVYKTTVKNLEDEIGFEVLRIYLISIDIVIAFPAFLEKNLVAPLNKTSILLASAPPVAKFREM